MTTNKNAPSKVCMTVLATTPQRSSRHGVTIAILLIVAQLVTGSGCGKTTQKDEDEKAASRQAAERRIAELAKKHGASTNWADSIRTNTYYLPALTFERQEAFDPLIGHPILAIVTIVDIYRTKDGCRLMCRLRADDPPFEAWGKLYFVLDLPQEKSRQLAGIPDECLGDVFAIVAVPSRADLRFHPEAEATDGEESPSEGAPSFELWVRGTCLEVEHVPGY
jgi:hypothetical protein